MHKFLEMAEAISTHRSGKKQLNSFRLHQALTWKMYKRCLPSFVYNNAGHADPDPVEAFIASQPDIVKHLQRFAGEATDDER